MPTNGTVTAAINATTANDTTVNETAVNTTDAAVAAETTSHGSAIRFSSKEGTSLVISFLCNYCFKVYFSSAIIVLPT